MSPAPAAVAAGTMRSVVETISSIGQGRARGSGSSPRPAPAARRRGALEGQLWGKADGVDYSLSATLEGTGTGMSADAELRDLMSAIASGPTSAAFDLLSAMPWL